MSTASRCSSCGKPDPMYVCVHCNNDYCSAACHEEDWEQDQCVSATLEDFVVRELTTPKEGHTHRHRVVVSEPKKLSAEQILGLVPAAFIARGDELKAKNNLTSEPTEYWMVDAEADQSGKKKSLRVIDGDMPIHHAGFILIADKGKVS
jgi:hypothetical protein